MKFSVKVQDSQPWSRQQNQPETRRPLLFRAKFPITIFNHRFISGFSTTTHQPSSDFSLFLATNFSSGQTLKLAYTATPSTTFTTSPLTLTLKSGLYGSPKNSPFIISANFSVNPHSLHSTPTFSLILKPQFGSFSLKGPSSSNPKGISVLARTEVPVTKRFLINCRWGVNFPEDLGGRMPHLSLNKIEIERVDVVEEKKKQREMDTLQRENREMKLKLEELNTGSSQGQEGKKKKNPAGQIGKKEVRKNGVESELQKAINSGFFFSP